MYRFERTGRAKNAKFIEARQWAKEVAEYITKKHSQVSIQVCNEVFDKISIIHWYWDVKDLATYEDITAQLMSDQGYWAIVSKGVECFIDGSFKDKLMRII